MHFNLLVRRKHPVDHNSSQKKTPCRSQMKFLEYFPWSKISSFVAEIHQKMKERKRTEQAVTSQNRTEKIRREHNTLANRTQG